MKMNVYVAGKAIERTLPLIKGVVWLEPYIYGDDIGEADSDIYVPRDLMLLRRADIVLVLLETGEELNTLIEAGIVYARGVPIISVINPELKGRARFLSQISTSVFINREDALDCLEIIGTEGWRQVLNELRLGGVKDGNGNFPDRR